MFQTFLAFVVFLGAVAASRWGIQRFVSDRARTSHPSLNFYSAVFVVAIVSLLLLRGLVEELGTSIGSAISGSRLSQGLGWLVTIFLAQLDQLQAIFGIFAIIFAVKPCVSIVALGKNG